MAGKQFALVTLRVKNFVEITLSCSISEIKAFLHKMQKFKMATKSVGGNYFCKKSSADSAHTLWAKNFVEIALSCSVTEINAFLRLMQKFKMAAKSGRKTIFWEKSPVHSPDTLWVKNFIEMALSRSVSDINAFLRLTQKFKMATVKTIPSTCNEET